MGSLKVPSFEMEVNKDVKVVERGQLTCESGEKSKSVNRSIKVEKSWDVEQNKDVESHSFSRKKEMVLLLATLFANVFTGIAYSDKAPFYPGLASSKGVSPELYSFALGSSDLMGCMFSFGAADRIYSLGTKTLSIMGLLFIGTAHLALSTIPYIAASRTFLGVSIFIIMFGSCGINIMYSIAGCLLTTVFPHQAGLMMSLVEGFYGIGTVIGPLLGGVLVDAMNFSLPFWVFGGAALLMTPLIYLSIPQIQLPNGNECETSIIDLLKIPRFWIGMLTIVISYINSSFQCVNLEPYLRPFELSDTVTGSIFSAYGLMYALISMCFGKILDFGVPSYVCMAGGFCLQIVGMSLMGPIYWVPKEATLPLIIAGVIINGIGNGASCVPAMVFLRETCAEKNVKLNIEVNGKISSVISGCISLGSLLGNCVGGVLYEKLGFRLAQFTIICIVFIMLTSTLLLKFVHASNFKTKRKKKKTSIVKH